MKGDSQVIDYLNQILSQELRAINQYFLHSKMFQNWGFDVLYKKEYEGSIDEMKHADSLIERILFLEGLPNLQKLGTLAIGENVKECLEADLQLELEGIPVLKTAIQHCEQVRDFVSRDLVDEILKSEEEHIDWLETQLELIKQVGIQNYLQQQMTPA